MSEIDDKRDEQSSASGGDQFARSGEPMARPIDAGDSAAQSVSPVVVARPVSAALGGFLVARPESPMMLAGYSRLAALADMAIFVIAAIALMVATILVAEALSAVTSVEPVPEGAGAGPQLAANVAGGLACAALVVALSRMRGRKIDSLGLTTARYRVNLLWGLVALPAVYGVHLVLAMTTMQLWPGAQAELENNADNLRAMIPDIRWYSYLLLFAGVSFYEEVIFRGFLLTRLRSLTGSWWLAVILSSAGFASLHIQGQVAATLPSLFGLGCVLSVFTLWRRSLIPAIVAHCLFNTANMLFLHWWMRRFGEGG